MINKGFMLSLLKGFKWKGQSISHEQYSHRDLRDIHETFFLTLLSTVFSGLINAPVNSDSLTISHKVYQRGRIHTRDSEREKKSMKEKLIVSYEIHSLGILDNNDLI